MQSKKRFNGMMIVIVVIIVAAASMLLLPSRQQVRMAKLRKELEKSVIFATAEDWTRLQGAPEFLIPSRVPKKGDLYVFVPALNNNIAFIAAPSANAFITSTFYDVDIHVLPASEPQSPATNMAMKLALSNPGPIGQSFIDEVGQHPTTAKKRILAAWEKVPMATQADLEKKVKQNQELSAQAGSFQAVLRYGPFTVKGAAWGQLQMPISQIRQGLR